VSETSTSGDSTNAAQVNLSYPTSLLQYQSISLSGPFTLCGQETGGSGSVNIGCASTTVVSGTQSIAQITFSVIASGSAPVVMSAGSGSTLTNIVNSTSGSSVWNGVLPSTSFTLSQPVTTPTPAKTPSSSPPSTTKSSGSSSSSSGTS